MPILIYDDKDNLRIITQSEYKWIVNISIQYKTNQVIGGFKHNFTKRMDGLEGLQKGWWYQLLYLEI